MRSLLCCLAFVLVFVTTGRAQQPPRDCESTGDNCRENCFAAARYQWCGDCTHYLDCTSGTPTYPACPQDFVWNDNAKLCAPTSPTCVQCVTPAAKCGGTGYSCLNDCLGQFDGVYQWCGRCDYFLQCSGGEATVTKCQQDTLFYDDNFKACVAVSSTCVDRPCDIPLGPCAPRPCLNGGTCHDNGDGTYWCQCLPGYSGSHCQDTVCASSPCLNGGTCYVGGGGGWYCVCPPQWTGQQCQTPTGPCTPNPCLNGGTCFETGNGHQCTCEISYTGSACESPNYQESCGTGLSKASTDAVNGFTILCYLYAPPNSPGRTLKCNETLINLPIWGNADGLLRAENGNFGCFVSPDNQQGHASSTCFYNYQQDVTLGTAGFSNYLMVCIHYPYEGINAAAAKRKV